MKRKLVIGIIGICALSITACSSGQSGSTAAASSSVIEENVETAASSAAEETIETGSSSAADETAEAKSSSASDTSASRDPASPSSGSDTSSGRYASSGPWDSTYAGLFAALEAEVEADIDATVESLENDLEQLERQITSFADFRNQEDEVEAYYEQVLTETEDLCIRIREYTAEYAEVILSGYNSDDYYTWLEILDTFYDFVYDDVLEDLNDEIYEDLFEDLQETFYEDIIEKAANKADPAVYAEVSSAQEERHETCRTAVYSAYRNCESDILDFWADLESDLWDEDMEAAEEDIADFRTLIENLKR